MSYGRVFHKDCPGEFYYYEIEKPFMCNHCRAIWDGKDWSIAEYRKSVVEKETPHDNPH